MTYEMIIEALNNIHPGSFVRVGYRTELPLKSSFSKQGCKIVRVSESTVRTGINYRNIQSVIEEKAGQLEAPRAHRKVITSVIKNKIYKNLDTDQMYLRVYPTRKGTNKKNTYLVITSNGDRYFSDNINNEMKEMIRDSYFDNKFRPISMIKIENVYRIGDVYGSYT